MTNNNNNNQISCDEMRTRKLLISFFLNKNLTKIAKKIYSSSKNKTKLYKKKF